MSLDAWMEKNYGAEDPDRPADTEREVERLRERVCQLENGGPSRSGHCSVCAFTCYGV